ncbi:PDR/VanB family oxidoreductase [Rhodococcus sp. NCIMB 12038]|uniref:PDR/VanB family oxidoreductase n=1 Tax=Rhodococcus sp. NCIMB 12038 TaxID=933800 RepID=UPI000B3CECBB|nr:PDR/VanB family oxidoreductase [Rhodococcus sp. NCIMB 12038]OUS94391.1 hypothetical protein CA951_18505 [Rhodococcus sp. NCIMB 12038]
MSATSQRRWTTATVIAAVDAADGVRKIVLEYRDPIRDPIEGSHLDVDVHIEGRTEVRSYSIVERDKANPRRLALGVHRALNSRGGSRYMHTLTAGMTLRTTQPLNSFPFRRTAGPVRFLAGGIGVTAVMSMAAAARARPAAPGSDYHLTYVGRAPSVMAFHDELAELHGEALTVHHSDTDGLFDVPTFVAGCPRESMLYLCGPIGLLDAVRTAWVGDGRALRDLRFETFGTTGNFPTESFTVTVPAQGLEVVVREDQSILEALEAAGAEMMFNCRKGECGLCQVDVRGVRGHIDHRDVFFSDQQHANGAKLCTCVTRIARATGAEAPAVTLHLP